MLPGPGTMSFTSAVPTAEPVEDQSSWPLIPSFAVKNSLLVVAVR